MGKLKPKKMIIQIVNEKDEITNYIPIETINYDKDIYRVSAIWITNSKEEILLARRGYNKKQNPGKWGPAAAGKLEKGETYESNIIKETKEEINLTIEKKDIRKGPKFRIKEKYNYFAQLFTLKIDKPIEHFKTNKKEVAEIKWFTKEELLKAVNEDSDELLDFLKKYIKENGIPEL